MSQDGATDAVISMTQSDVLLLRRMLKDYLNGRFNTVNRPAVDEPDIIAPEVYVALTPSGGIPALTNSGSDASGPGTAVCEIWMWNHTTGLLVNSNFTKPVYNVYGAWPGNEWVMVKRDKWGTWWTDSVSGGSGSFSYTVTGSGGTDNNSETFTVGNGLSFTKGTGGNVGNDTTALAVPVTDGTTTATLTNELTTVNAGVSGVVNGSSGNVTMTLGVSYDGAAVTLSSVTIGTGHFGPVIFNAVEYNQIFGVGQSAGAGYNDTITTSQPLVAPRTGFYSVIAWVNVYSATGGSPSGAGYVNVTLANSSAGSADTSYGSGQLSGADTVNGYPLGFTLSHEENYVQGTGPALTFINNSGVTVEITARMSMAYRGV